MKCNPAFGLHCNPASYVREGGVGLIYSSLESTMFKFHLDT